MRYLYFIFSFLFFYSAFAMPDWQKPYYTPGKHAFSSPICNLTAIGNDCMLDKITLQQAHEILMAESEKGNSAALEKIYGLYLLKGHEDLAKLVLAAGINDDDPWAYFVYGKKGQKPEHIKAIGKAASFGHKPAIVWINKHLGYTRETVPDFLEAIALKMDALAALNNGGIGKLSGKAKQAAKKKRNGEIDRLNGEIEKLYTDFVATYENAGYAAPIMDLLSYTKWDTAKFEFMGDRQREALYKIFPEDGRRERELHKKAADMGNLEACISCAGDLFVKGKEEEAYPYYVKAAKQNDAGSLNNAGGFLYRQEAAINAFTQKPYTFMQRAADLEHLDAIVVLGIMYYGGQGVEVDRSKAFACFEFALKKDPHHQNALYSRGMLYKDQAEEQLEVPGVPSDGVPSDMIKGLKDFVKAANAGHSQSAYFSAYLIEKYGESLGTHADIKKYYAQAWCAGHVDAGVALAGHYLYRAKNESAVRSGLVKKALDLFFLAKDKGSARAMYELGLFYHFHVKQTPASEAKAMAYYQMALGVNKEYQEAQYFLALLYYQRGDVSRALKMMKESADAGDVDAMLWLSEYYLALATPDDEKRGLEFVLQAIQKESVSAQELYDVYQQIQEKPMSITIQDVLMANAEKEGWHYQEIYEELLLKRQQALEKQHKKASESLSSALIAFEEVLVDVPSSEPAVVIKENTFEEGDETFEFELSPPKKRLNAKGRRAANRNTLTVFEEEQKKVSLSPEHQDLVQMIFHEQGKNLAYADLVKLFQDPFFEGKVTIKPTQNGFMISAKKDDVFLGTSRHVCHKGSAPEGFQRFLGELKEILNLFGLGA